MRSPETLQRPLRDSGGLRRNADAATIERGKRDLVAIAFFSYAIFDWHLAIGERKPGASRGVDSEFLFFFANGESRRAFFNDQRRDSLLSFFRLRVHVDDRRIGCATVGDPGLRAVDDVASPLRTAFVARAAAFEPACGSVRA